MSKGQSLIDITGQKFNRLTCIGFSHIGERRRSYWYWRCDCGKVILKRKDQVIYTHSRVKSCGCQMIESSRAMCKKRNAENNPAKRGDEHHMRKTGTFRAKHDEKTGRFTK